MNDRRRTPTIEIAIGRELRLYHAYVTTAPPKLDAPATLTVHSAPLWDVLGMAAAFIALDAERAKHRRDSCLWTTASSSGKRRNTRRHSTCSPRPTRCSLGSAHFSTRCGTGFDRRIEISRLQRDRQRTTQSGPVLGDRAEYGGTP